MNHKVKKVLRFWKIYGFKRTMIKVAGRTRKKQLNVIFRKKNGKKDISLIGCGQFGFSTISYFINEQIGNRFLECYDIDGQASKTTSEFWGYKVATTPEELIKNPNCKYVYIASDHYSHTDYAIAALKAGKVVYCEKPISVTFEQLNNLEAAIKDSKGNIYFGYNRPFSAAIRNLGKHSNEMKHHMTISFFILGHKLPEDHWYNDPKEGTRICGNLGHWIDLSMYLFALRGGLPRKYDISFVYSDDKDIENMSISYSTEMGDVVTFTFCSRAEAFEGINETIDFQCGDVISKIDDFRNQTIWMKDKIEKYRFNPKDVGHKTSIVQPFIKEKRDINVVLDSTKLMLAIRDNALNHSERCLFELP